MAAPNFSIKRPSSPSAENIEDEKTVGAVTEPTYDVSESGEEDAPALPFSRARCLALVATLTGASFLNVYFYSYSLKKQEFSN